MSINKVVISGNLTRDAELRATAGGTSVLAIGVAVNERRRQGDEWVDYANYVDCTLFGRRADAIARYLVKGTKVCIEGRLHYGCWEQDGQRRSKLTVNVDEIEFMSRAKQDARSQQPDAAHAVQAAYPGAKVEQYAGEDIPF